MSYHRNLRFYIKSKGLIFFLFFFIMPTLVSSLLLYCFKGNELLAGNLLIVQILSHYFFFILFFMTLKKFFLFPAYFFKLDHSRKEVFQSVSFAVISFFIAILIVNAFIQFMDSLAVKDWLHDWVTAQNPGLDEVFSLFEHKNYALIILWSIIIVLITPLVEEILFRGFLQDFFEKLFSKRNPGRFTAHFDVILVALIFALFHINSLANIVFALMIGLLLSYQRKKSKRIIMPILTHSIVNLLGLSFGMIDYWLA